MRCGAVGGTGENAIVGCSRNAPGIDRSPQRATFTQGSGSEATAVAEVAVTGQEKGHMAGNRSLRKVRCGRRAAIGVQRDEVLVLVEPHVPEICVREVVVARLLASHGQCHLD